MFTKRMQSLSAVIRAAAVAVVVMVSGCGKNPAAPHLEQLEATGANGRNEVAPSAPVAMSQSSLSSDAIQIDGAELTNFTRPALVQGDADLGGAAQIQVWAREELRNQDREVWLVVRFEAQQVSGDQTKGVDSYEQQLYSAPAGMHAAFVVDPASPAVNPHEAYSRCLDTTPSVSVLPVGGFLRRLWVMGDVEGPDFGLSNHAGIVRLAYNPVKIQLISDADYAARKAPSTSLTVAGGDLSSELADAIPTLVQGDQDFSGQARVQVRAHAELRNGGRELWMVVGYQATQEGGDRTAAVLGSEKKLYTADPGSRIVEIAGSHNSFISYLDTDPNVDAASLAGGFLSRLWTMGDTEGSDFDAAHHCGIMRLTYSPLNLTIVTEAASTLP